MSVVAHEVFARYVQERRGRPLRGYTLDTPPGLTRYTAQRPGVEGIILFAQLRPDELEASIAAQIAHFEACGQDFEWKVYDFDQPPDLAAALTRNGFSANDTEAFMVYPVASHRSRALRAGIRVERVTDETGIRTMAALQTEIWRENLSWLEDWLREVQQAGALFLAWLDDRPVGTGWINFTPHSTFADLHGGGVLAECRGRGVYSALFDRRVEEARERGVPYLAVDAAPMSRPILAGQGFELVCNTTPLRWRVRSGRSDARA